MTILATIQAEYDAAHQSYDRACDVFDSTLNRLHNEDTDEACAAMLEADLARRTAFEALMAVDHYRAMARIAQREVAR
jgi:hypothetical protein